ncbi:LiaF domain-containing protein [Veronia pacifica]|uniref:Cell wall-active antibiotics response LiaF-like C-terminal domain-containing protein n=1 Tax=Veronia pacifica TaxID=1080227 RepID=A0A1C3EKY1_9GAMM|nr:LiaF domain-containing protein [Veronia pacifica]ODA33880.1 hypothetical protein A8L45_08635 [Veronia pacifica]
MSVKLDDRPIEKVREETVDKLIYNYSHGVISNAAFERRLDIVMEATTHQEIVEQISDLDMEVDSEYVKSKSYRFSPRYTAEQEESQDETILAFMGGNDRSGAWIVPKKLNVATVMGGAVLDFTDAIFKHKDIRITVFCLMGGVELQVPKNVNVVTRTLCIMGGVENKIASTIDMDAPTITIDGFVGMGGLEIKVRELKRDAFIKFAQELKKTGLFSSKD